jgi:hypothetical protein
VSDDPENHWAGMDSGSDRGAPGEHLPDPPLSEDEQRMLGELRRRADAAPIEAIEDSPEAIEAVEDDTPLPADGDRGDDPDTTRFRAPGE